MKKGKKNTKSASAYAKHRGVTPSAVTKAIRTGRLRESLARDRRGVVTVPDFDVADREWDAHTRFKLDAKAAAKLDTKTADVRARHEHAQARKEHARAALTEITVAERLGALVTRTEIRSRIGPLFASCRARLLGIVGEVAKREAGLAAEQLALLEALIREAIEEISDASAAAFADAIEGEL